jgi:hypothetical protein
MAGFGLVVDSTEDNAGANTPLNLADSTNYVLTEIQFPDPPLKSVWAESFDTEGSVPTTEHQYENREVMARVRIYGGGSASTLQNNISALEQKVGKINRMGGSLELTLPSGDFVFFDAVAAQVTELTLNNSMTANRRTEATVTFTCRPFYRRQEVGNLTDAFAVDSLNGGGGADILWTLDSGSGITVTGGVLDPSSTSAKRLHRLDRWFYDAQVTVKVTTGSTVASLDVGPTLKWQDDSNFLFARIGANLAVGKRDGGSDSTLATTAHTPSTATSYWVRLRVEGQKATAEVFTSAPTATSTPAASVSHTLTSGDDIQFGSGVIGRAGLRLTPATATAESYDDFTVEPYLYRETSLPALTTGPIYVPGDVPALGRLLLHELDGDTRWAVRWGLQDKGIQNEAIGFDYYQSTHNLFYEAEDSGMWTLAGGASVVTGPSGASGGGSNNVVRQATLTPVWQAMMTTASPQHTGSFELYARVHMPATNTGEVSIRFDWATGIGNRITQNDPVTFAADHSAEGSYTWVSLGLFHIPPPLDPNRTNRWKGDIVAKSTVVADDLDVDCTWLRPTSAGGGKLSGIFQVSVPTTFSARDEFDQTAGALTGKTAPVGGTWAGAGDADDGTVETTGKTVVRSAVSDTGGGGRFWTLNLNLTDTVVQVDFKRSTVSNDNSPFQGVLARWTDVNNHVWATVSGIGSVRTLRVNKVIGGVGTSLLLADNVGFNNGLDWSSIRLVVLANGYWEAQGAFVQGGQFVTIGSGSDPVLATGGTLATGDPGFTDGEISSNAVTRNYDNFAAWVPARNAALFASRRLELRHNAAESTSETSDSIWTPTPSVRGSYFTVPAGGVENLASRLTLIATDNDLGEPDPGIRDLQAQVFYTPRGLIVPETGGSSTP